MARRTPIGLLLTVAVSLVLAGCLPPPAPPPDDATPSPSPPAPPASDNPCAEYDRPAIEDAPHVVGANAFAFVLQLICDFDATPAEPRYRVPGTDGQAEAALWLQATLASHGWDAAWQNFTGAEYADLPKGAAGFYYEGAQYCSAEDRQRLMGLPFANVVATRPGTTDGILLLMAHWDSKRFADRDPDPSRRDSPVLGANDGASGVGVLLEVARHWRDAELPFETRILLTDGEDGFEDCHPLAGSIYYAHHLAQAEVDRFRGVFLLDMVGNQTDAFWLDGNSRTLADLVIQAAQELDVPQVANASFGSGVMDDHTPFMERGIPAVDLIPSGFSSKDYWHTTHDVPQKLSADFLGDVGRIVVRFTELLEAHQP